MRQHKNNLKFTGVSSQIGRGKIGLMNNSGINDLMIIEQQEI